MNENACSVDIFDVGGIEQKRPGITIRSYAVSTVRIAYASHAT